MWSVSPSATLRTMSAEAVPADLLCAVERYRRRLTSLLDGLDDARRAAADAGVTLLAGDGGDLAPLLDCFSYDLRDSGHRLQTLVDELAPRP
jgi:hypothetical protein